MDLSEFLADQWALRQGQSSDDVATALLNCATKMRQQHNMQLSLAMTGKTSRLRSRIEEILRNGGKAMANLSLAKKTVATLGIVSLLILVPKFEYSYAAQSEADKENSPTQQPAETATELESRERELSRQLEELAAQQDRERHQLELLSRAQEEAVEQLEFKQRQLAQEQEQIRNQVEVLERLQSELAQSTGQLNSTEREAKREQLRRQQTVLQQQVNAVKQKQQDLAKEQAEKAAAIRAAETAATQQHEALDDSRSTIHALQQELLTLAQNSNSSVNIRSTNGRSHAKWTDNGQREEIFWRGDIGVNDEETTITSLDRNGYFEYSSSGFNPDRSIEFKRDGGNIVIDYKVGAEKREFSEADHEWFHAVLVRFFRRTGTGAEERVERLLRRGGVDTVVEELSYISSDSAHRIYTTTLVKKQALTDEQFSRVLKATDTISSDSEMRRLMLAILEYGNVKGARWNDLLPATMTISSDSEMRRLLQEIASTKTNLSKEQWHYFLQAADTISSDSEARRLLESVVNNSNALASNHEQLFHVANSISSDSELRRLLSEPNLLTQLNDKHWDRYFQVANTISSDSEMAELLIAVMESAKLDANAWKRALYLTDESISSSSEKGRVLRQAAKKIPDNRDLQDLYNNTVKNISSRSTRESLSLL